MFRAPDDRERWLHDCVAFRLPDTVGAGETRVWTVDVDLPPEELLAAELLSADELARAERFHFEKDRRRFTVSRGALRTILGAVLGLDPARLGFRYGAHGKPALDGAAGGTIYFNVSHSEGVALVAVSEDRELGVDVELVRQVPELEGIVDRFFSARERTLILGDSQTRERAFFYHWTLKEAWLKGVGTGLSGPLTGVEVSRLADGTPKMRRVDDEPGEYLPWHCVCWTPAPGFQAALAVAL